MAAVTGQALGSPHVTPHPPLQPHASGHLDVSDGNRIYWESSGNPDGKPALWLHGGPGAGGGRGSRRLFDPDAYRIVLFDQRGCGQSEPHAADPEVSLEHNTTEHLLADIERLREHLGVDRWLLYGGSWGCTLALAYAQRHPDRVSEIVLVAISLSTPAEVDWLYRGVRVLVPGPWEDFRRGSGLPGDPAGVELVAAYDRLLNSPDAAVRDRAAVDWCAWEDAVIAHEPRAGHFSATFGDTQRAFTRICAHYYSHHAWLDDGALLRGMGRIAHVPAVLIHGRLDFGCPLKTAWDLAAAWPAADLVIIDDSGHTGSPALSDAIHAATARFAPAEGA